MKILHHLYNYKHHRVRESLYVLCCARQRLMMYGGGDVMEIGDTQTACSEACATLQNLNRLELQKLEDDNEALQSLIDDMAIVIHISLDMR